MNWGGIGSPSCLLQIDQTCWLDIQDVYVPYFSESTGLDADQNHYSCVMERINHRGTKSVAFVSFLEIAGIFEIQTEERVDAACCI